MGDPRRALTAGFFCVGLKAVAFNLALNHPQASATRWLWTYNHERPNMALGGITPMQKLKLAA